MENPVLHMEEIARFANINTIPEIEVMNWIDKSLVNRTVLP
jgi:hypothetical protein